MSWKRPEIAIDFGTANVRVMRREEGIVFDEPSLCCFSRRDGMSDLVAVGTEAHAMIDRTPANLSVKRPLCRGVLQDIDAATGLLRYALSRSIGGKRMRAPNALIGVPADATQAERSAMLTAANDAGFGHVTLVSEPLAAAFGAGLPVEQAAGSMVIECGAGTTEVAVFSLGGICATGTVRIGGVALDKAIADQLHLRHKFLVGELSAERLKLEYVARRQDGNGERSDVIAVRGRCLREGLPKSMDVAIRDVDQVVEKHVEQIVQVVRDVLGRTAPELSQDIHDRGVTLTGGGALMPLMGSMIADATGLEVKVAEAPSICVANGLHRMLCA
ncbi:rod shape-determining protein [Novosphingobium album (ex Liu et al. 2023)]|uniref:Cell shape-determining protein MreB n=1 Tax=Novosphingobium album (ex Liu et al. 2023) TaxID=3031130 RepID=A0ABT5WWK5_9SPHN|nr:rod shape-determining protein [Novosphingobium album (ex Liu et al. 2023)]MDE8654247.1 rod shape-determining protein [Novosphingobium album (ex Liu et al. 2023)]